MKIVRKHPVTLIELLVAMGLMVIVLSLLGFFYHQMTIINAEIASAEAESFRRLYLQYRLQDTVPKALVPKKKERFFFVSGPVSGLMNSESLVFSYDNGIDLEKKFSNEVLGRLYLDPEKRLILITWPAFKRIQENEEVPMKKEVLLENVDDLSFQFLSLRAKEDPGGWIDQWSIDQGKLPAMVKIVIRRGKETVVYTYPMIYFKGIIEFL